MRIEIRRASDGLVRVYHEARAWEGELSKYIWSRGNYGCDCNRELFFAGAADEEEPDNLECGDKRFAVRITADDGSELYKDDRW